MKHIQLFEQFINENKDEVIFSVDNEKLDQILHSKFGRKLDYEDIKGDSYYSLPKREFDSFIDFADSSGFDVDYDESEASVIYVYESRVNEKAYQLTGMYGAKGIAGKVLFAFKKEIERLKFEGDVQDTLKEINQVWSKWADDEGAQIIADEVMKQVKDKEAIVYITAALSKHKWVNDQVNGLNRPNGTELFVRISGDFVINIGFADDVDAYKYARKLGGMQNYALVSGIETTIAGEYMSSVGQNNIEIRQSLILSIDAK